jgi:hypothetical protein
MVVRQLARIAKGGSDIRLSEFVSKSVKFGLMDRNQAPTIPSACCSNGTSGSSP